jgi:ubiquitin-protein ligase E3 A
MSMPNRDEVAKTLAKSADRQTKECTIRPPMWVGNRLMTDRLNRFDSWARHVIHEAHPDINLALQMLRENVDLFSCILCSTKAPLSSRNSSIDDELMEGFAQKLARLSELDGLILQIVSHIVFLLKTNEFVSFSDMRAFFVLLYFPAIWGDQKILASVLNLLADKTQVVQTVFERWFMYLPKCLETAVGACKFAISVYFGETNNKNFRSAKLFGMLDALKTTFHGNQMAGHPLDPSSFHLHHITELIDPASELKKPEPNFCTYAFALSLQAKAALCMAQSTEIMISSARRAHHEIYPHGIWSIFGRILRHQRLVMPEFFLQIHVRRSHIIEDSIIAIEHARPEDFLKKLLVVFEGEEAVDAGGPSREFLYLLTDKLMSLDYGMFRVVENKYMWFASGSFEEVHSFLLVGAIIGLAVYNSVVLPIRFPLCLYKKILNPQKPLTLTDLAEIDSMAAHSLREIELMGLRGEDISELSLNFTITLEQFGRHVTYDLCEGGSGVDVTNENYEYYIDLYIDFVLVRSVEVYFDGFLTGFRLSIQAPAYGLLDPSELDILVSGEDQLDWFALKEKTVYQDGYSVTSRAVVWFWEIFDAMEEGQKKKFLKFAIGTDRAPLGGLANVQLVVQRVEYSRQLPTSHTCFLMFSLPDYPTKQEMGIKIRTAIEESEGFGFV